MEVSKKKRKRKKKLKYKNKLILLLVLVIGLIGGSCYFLVSKSESVLKVMSYDKYLASNNNETVLYVKNEDGSLEVKEKISRGKMVTTQMKTYDFEDESYVLIMYENEEYYVSKDSLVDSEDEIVLEDRVFVRSSCSILKDLEDAYILGLAKKGEQLEVLGYEGMLDEGKVLAYKVRQGDIEGYVYSKYMVFEEEEAMVNYNASVNDAVHGAVKDSYGGGSALKLDYYPYEKVSFEENKMPEAVYSLYLNSSSSVIANIDDYISYAKGTKINTFVVDIVDNTMIAYPSEVMKELSLTSYEKAVNSLEDYKMAIEKIKAAGFYVVGRITVFKDDFYVQDNPDEAISALSDGKPYLHQSAYWPSAYSRKVWYYKVRLAKEAVEEFGFNEINFDYTRFPDLIRNKEYLLDMKNVYQEDKVEAIQRFLMYASDELHKQEVYVSVDVFGESAVNSYTTAYGQYWPAISNVVDVICGMPYPDHFARGSYGIEEPWDNPYLLMKSWGEEVYKRQQETTSPAIVRTWVQAYPVMKHVDSNGLLYNASEVQAEIDGLYDANLTGGYITWLSNSSLEKYKLQEAAFQKDYMEEYKNDRS